MITFAPFCTASRDDATRNRTHALMLIFVKRFQIQRGLYIPLRVQTLFNTPVHYRFQPSFFF